MGDGRHYTREQIFMNELVKDIYEDVYTNQSDDPSRPRVYTVLREHLHNVVSDPFTADELVSMEQSLKDDVRDLTDNDINLYLGSRIVVLSEYLETPEEILDYVARPRNNR